MKVLALLSVLLAAVATFAASTGNVVLTWQDALNPAGDTYNVYRAPVACSQSPTFTKVNTSPVTALTYTDQNLPVNTRYCYYVTAFDPTTSLESGASNYADVKPKPPTSLVAQ